MIDTKEIEKMAGSLKKGIKSAHQKLMAQVPPEQRGELQGKLNAMIDNAKKESGHPFMNDFMKEIYGR